MLLFTTTPMDFGDDQHRGQKRYHGEDSTSEQPPLKQHNSTPSTSLEMLRFLLNNGQTPLSLLRNLWLAQFPTSGIVFADTQYNYPMLLTQFPTLLYTLMELDTVLLQIYQKALRLDKESKRLDISAQKIKYDWESSDKITQEDDDYLHHVTRKIMNHSLDMEMQVRDALKHKANKRMLKVQQDIGKLVLLNTQ